MATSSRPPRRVRRRVASPPIIIPPGLCLRVTPQQFEAFCTENGDLRLERTAQGRLIVMAPAGFKTGGRNLKLSGRLYNWAEANGTGVAGDSSTGYTLPNGAILAPDASWVSNARVAMVPTAELEGFAHLCPDFAVELRSPSDRLKTAQRKMAEYIEQGVRLGWLIDPIRHKVEIYRPGREPEVLDKPESLSGEDVLPGFVLDLQGILFE